MNEDLATREAQLLQAHELRDLNILMQLYATRALEVEPFDLDAACFYMVNAYVFALELGASEHEKYFEFLYKNGREEQHATI